MATAVEQSQTLSGITDTLNKIKGALGSMSAEEKAKFDNSGVASGMKDVFSATGGVFSDLQVENGVLTSRSAQQAVNNANNVIGSAGTSGEKSPMQLLQEANAKLQKEFEKQKEVNKELEANASIAQQKAEQPTATIGGGEGASQPQVDPTTGEPTTAQDGTPTEASTIPGLEDDPVALAMTQAFNERLAITNANIQRLQDFVDAEDEDTQRIISSLKATAASQTKRIEKENARLAQAAQVAGIIAGRGMYSPEEHEGIVSEVIQEGLDRVADIENTRDTAIIEAKKAQREFNYKAYVEMSDMVEALSDLKRQAIIDMKDRLIEIETQEREKQRFDQEQADRNAFILAPELMDATSEEIYKAALANGIEPGLLAREVQAYKDEQAMNALDIEGKQQDIALQKERILSEQNDRYIAWQKYQDSLSGADGELPETDEIMSLERNLELAKQFNLTTNEGGRTVSLIPNNWTERNIGEFIELYGDVPDSERKNMIEKYSIITKSLENNPNATDGDLNKVLDSIESPEEKKKRVKELLFGSAGATKMGHDSLASQAAVDGLGVTARVLPGGKAPTTGSYWGRTFTRGEKEAKTWYERPDVQKDIEDMVNEGLEAYQIVRALAKKFNVSEEKITEALNNQ